VLVENEEGDAEYHIRGGLLIERDDGTSTVGVRRRREVLAGERRRQARATSEVSMNSRNRSRKSRNSRKVISR
jgi:hypothetical protein